MRNGIPNSLKVHLQYNQYSNFASTSTNVQSYRANSPYDPDYTGAGGQPVGYDAWAALYSRYYVTQCDFELSATNNGANPVILAVFPSPVATTSVDTYGAAAQPGAKFIELGGNGAQNRGKITSNLKMLEWLGLPSFQQGMYAAVSTNPATGVFWIICAENFGGTAIDVYVDVRLTYHIRFMYITELPPTLSNKMFIDETGRHYVDPDREEKYQENLAQRKLEESQETLSKKE